MTVTVQFLSTITFTNNFGQFVPQSKQKYVNPGTLPLTPEKATG